jgi:hypothetical protein
MIRHVVCLTFTPDSTAEQRETVRAALSALPGIISEIRAYTVGADLGLAEGNAHLAIVADFESVDDYRTYAQDPRHQAVISELIRPILASRTAAQTEMAT